LTLTGNKVLNDILKILKNRHAGNSLCEPMETVVLIFGRYAIDLERRCLIREGDIVPLGGKAFDVLVVLVGAKGAIVPKDTLIEHVWGGRIVNDNAVEAQIHGLRRSLGSDRNLVKTVAGKGYCLVMANDPRGRPPTNLQSDLSSLVTREGLLADIRLALNQHRLVTLLGPGGIGKSRLARVAGWDELDHYSDGVWMVELSSIESERFIHTAIAGVFDITLRDFDDRRSLVQALSGRTCLILLDNCEHLLDAVAIMVVEVLSGCPGIRILATSREALQIDGERVIGIPALNLPSDNAPLQDRLASPAVQLFLQRFMAGNGAFALQRDLYPLIEICRRVDGIPLAIEMAAAAARIFGVKQVLHELDTSFSILGVSRRAAIPRQQTMEASIEWSYRLLTLQEQMVFRSLSLLAGMFGTEAAATATDIRPVQLIAILSSLAAKSLLTVTATEQGALFHLLETMRQYARSRLDEADEYSAVAARLALQLRASADMTTPCLSLVSAPPH
jgi:non-specific serine/threonine protein kinase